LLFHANRCVKCAVCAKAACVNNAYEQAGFRISPDKLAEKLLRDKIFYDHSNGGVTFSGGEPAMQSDFFIQTAKILKSESVHIALDTSGFVPWEKLAPLVSVADLVLYDIKAFDNVLHMAHTDADNKLILDNAKRISTMGKEIVIRMIIVPGVNDSEQDIGGRLMFMRSLGSVRRVDILMYHKLGAWKYAALGIDEPMPDTPVCTPENIRYAAEKAADMGFDVTVG
jgi:pyruvate formate lyase activating enzyme